MPTSLTTWMRLEPSCRNPDMSAGLQARVYDPLWLLARQWQLGEFQGEDNGSPAIAQWTGESARLSRYFSGPLPAAPVVSGKPFDSNAIPLETLVECEPVRTNIGTLERLRFAVEAGQHFLRCLDQQLPPGRYRDLFTNKYLFTPLSPDERGKLDDESLNFVNLVASRAPDGGKIYAAMNSALRPPPPAQPKLPADLTIPTEDRAEVRAAAETWLRWYDTLITEQAFENSSWSTERMEYNFSIAARIGEKEKVLTAQEYFSGHLDWHDFNVNDPASLDATRDAASVELTQITMSAPISYRGMPAPRFWEFEDAQVDFGAVKAAPEDLAHMLLVEFAISYGNDWFVIPVELPVGSMCRTQSLVITNTFGERFLIPSPNEVTDSLKGWRMFQLSSMAEPGKAATVKDGNLFLLPSAIVTSIESPPIEEVLFLRDEMANMAWGVERVIESAIGAPLKRFEQEDHAPESLPPSQGKAIYKLATDVPDYWVPLMPVSSDDGLRLRRAKMLHIEQPTQPTGALGRILNPAQDALAIFEEEIPREGIRVTRHYQLARWQDGSTHLWIGRKKKIGRGEGSSGLKFDTLQD
jgi:hypothetical protein